MQMPHPEMLYLLLHTALVFPQQRLKLHDEKLKISLKSPANHPALLRKKSVAHLSTKTFVNKEKGTITP